MDFPLAFHKDAFKAHEAANCAGEQMKYRERHNRIYTKKGLTAPQCNDLLGHAAAIGLDFLTFKQCVDRGRGAAEIHKDIEDGEAAGGKATPPSSLGLTKPNDSTLVVLKALEGSLPHSTFKEVFEELLRAAPRK